MFVFESSAHLFFFSFQEFLQEHKKNIQKQQEELKIT